MIPNLEKKLERYIGIVKNKLWHQKQKQNPENFILEMGVT